MQVIGAVCSFLEKRGFEDIDAVKSVYEKKADICAKSPETKSIIKVEAKGQTTSKETARKGQEFDQSQKQDHLGRALLKALQYLDEGAMAAIALPNDDYDLKLVNSIKKSLMKLGVIVFLVSKDGSVHIETGELPR
jgi:hypothetical protein